MRWSSQMLKAPPARIRTFMRCPRQTWKVVGGLTPYFAQKRISRKRGNIPKLTMFHCNVNLMRVVEKVCYSHFHCAEIAQLTIVSYQTITTESRRERKKEKCPFLYVEKYLSFLLKNIFPVQVTSSIHKKNVIMGSVPVTNLNLTKFIGIILKFISSKKLL